MFDLALRLGKTVGEIEQMKACELNEWKAYIKILSEEAGNAQMDSNAMALALKAKRKGI